MKLRTSVLLVLAPVLLVVSCGDESTPPPPDPPSAATAGTVGPATPKSVIFLIGDGMGPQQLGLLFDWADAADAGETNLAAIANEGVLGMLRTGAADSPLTDSAASATALATGHRTYNGAISVDVDRNPVPTCLEAARDAGRMTGLVSSTRITHATPACFAAHVENRGAEGEIARQLVEESRVDVLLGGGTRFFPRPLQEKAAAAGYTVIGSGKGLENLPSDTTKVLGLFSASHLPFAIDRDGEDEAKTPSLTDLTSKALEILGSSPTGFFLMIEGGRIDHGGHANDVAAVLGELREFDRAVGLARAYRKSHPDTLVLVTSDHETGGLAISRSTRMLSSQDFLDMAAAEHSVELLEEREPTGPDAAQDLGVGRRSFYPSYSLGGKVWTLERSAGWNVSFGTQSHTTTPVAVFAVGPGADAFAGLHHHAHVGATLLAWMGK